MQQQSHTPTPNNIRQFTATRYVTPRKRRRVFRWRVCVTNILTLLYHVALMALGALWLAGMMVWLLAWALTW